MRAAIAARRSAARPVTMSELARAVGVSPPTLHQMLTGARPMTETVRDRLREVMPEVEIP